MRSATLARVVIATLGVCVVLTLGCGDPPSAPSEPWDPSEPTRFRVLTMSPAEGLTGGATISRITGTGFQSGAIVTVDGSRVNATVLSATTISLVLPAHAAGKVDVTVSQVFAAPASVYGGFTYVSTVAPPPVISELLPTIGSTGGGTPITIRGIGFRSNWTVIIGGMEKTAYSSDSMTIKVFTDSHMAGTVDVIITNPDGQTASSKFTYASPATFDFNGDWEGIGTDWDGEVIGTFAMTIRDNIVISALCNSSSLTLAPPPVVANGQFRFVASDGGQIDGSIVSPNLASGYITVRGGMTSPQIACGMYWSAEKK